jgi:hypothetical protein
MPSPARAMRRLESQARTRIEAQQDAEREGKAGRRHVSRS